MIKIIKKETFIPDLSKGIYYISWTPFSNMSRTGYSQMAWVDAVIRRNLNSDLDIENNYLEVDSKSEVGTLYPRLNVTLIPSSRKNCSEQEISKQIEDVLTAQTEYIKAENIIIDMRNHSYVNPQTNKYDNKVFVDLVNDIFSVCKDLEDTNVFFVFLEKEEIGGYEEATYEEINKLELNK